MSGQWGGISRIRVVIGTAGVLLLTFGVFRLGTEIPVPDLLALALWLGGALVLQDAVLSRGSSGWEHAPPDPGTGPHLRPGCSDHRWVGDRHPPSR